MKEKWEIIKRPPSVSLFGTLYKKLYISFTFKDILIQFSHNVYAYKNMPAINFGLILKNKMAVIAVFQFFSHIFSYPLSFAVL